MALRKPNDIVPAADLYGLMSLSFTVRLFKVAELATIALPSLVMFTSKSIPSMVTFGEVISNKVSLPLPRDGTPV